MPVVNILGGVLLLAFGRRIFWLFVAVTGFFAGFELTTQYLKVSPEWVVFAIAIVVGLVGAVLAYFLEKVAIGLAGFFVGAYLGSRLITEVMTNVQGWEWLVILITGIIGVVLMLLVFDWALIILSSLAGAALIIEGFALVGFIALVVGVVLFIAGVLIQSQIGGLRKGPSQPTTVSAET